MKIHALGPLTVQGADRRSLPLSPKPRQVLGLLVTHADHAVSHACFFEELWECDPPRTAVTTLQTYIGQVRRVIADAAGLTLAEVADRILVTVGGGYMLSADRLSLDVTEYHRLDRAGCLAVRTGDYERASALLRSALALWRGPALVNVCCGRLLSAQVARMEEQRLSTQEHRVLAQLHLGEHYALVAELAGLTAAHPLHEALHGHLMLALYRCGRRAEALSVLRSLRRRLRTELGLDPSPFLGELEHAILSGDRSLDLHGAGRHAGPVAS